MLGVDPLLAATNVCYWVIRIAIHLLEIKRLDYLWNVTYSVRAGSTMAQTTKTMSLCQETMRASLALANSA